MITTPINQNRILLKLIISSITFLALFIAAQTIFNSKVFAVNETGFGWAIPIRNDTDSPCSAGGLAPGSQRIVVVLRDANNGNLVNGNIRMAYGGTTTSPGTQTNVSQAEIDCVNVSRGVHVGVWNASGYRTWDQSANADQGGLGTRQFNWCCGFISLNPSQDRGKTVYYNIYLVPNGGPATITGVGPLGTAAPGQIINSTGATTPVNFQVRIGSALPQCGGGTQSINVYLRVINVATGNIVSSTDEGSFFSNFPFGSTQTFTKNLPNGTYRWYAQYHENPRRCGFINDSIPITSQFPVNYFTIQAPVVTPPPVGPPPVGPPPPPVTPPPPPAGANPADLRVVVFNDLNGNGIYDSTSGETTFPLSQTPGIEIRKNATNGFFVPLDGPTNPLNDYEEDVAPGTYQIFMQPGSALTPTRYSFGERLQPMTAFNYVAATAPYVRTNSHNLGANQIWVFHLGARIAAPSNPDYVVNNLNTLDPVSGALGITPAVGQNVAFRATVVNTGTANATVVSNGRFCVYPASVLVPLAQSGCYAPTGPVAPIGVRPSISIPALNRVFPGNSVTLSSNDSVAPPAGLWVAQPGSWNAIFCADTRTALNSNGLIDEGVNDGALNNCGVYNFTTTGANPWLRTEDGNVFSQGPVQLNAAPTTLPAAEQELAEYLVISGVSIPGTLNTVKNWLVGPYTNNDPGPNTYQELFDQFGVGPPTGVYVYNADVTWDGTANVGTCTAGSQGIVVFIDGSLILNGSAGVTSFSPSCPTVIIASGEIRASGNITAINAVLISDGRFVSVDLPGPQPINRPLQVSGGIYYKLNGPSPGPVFNRDLGAGNNSTPTERIVFKPEYLWYLRNQLGTSKSVIREINP